MEQKWYYLGRWDSPFICQSFFMHYYKEKIFADAGLPLISGTYRVVDYDCFLPQSDKTRVENFFYSKLAAGDSGVLFSFVEKARRSTFVVDKTNYDLNSLQGFKKFVSDVAPMFSYWMVVHMADPGVEKALIEKCEASGIDLFDALSQLKHDDLELFQREKQLALLSSLYKRNKLTKSDLDAFLEKFAWTSTHAFMGSPFTSEKLLMELEKFEPLPQSKVQKLDLNWPELKIAGELAFLRLRFIELFDKVTFKFWSLLEKIGKERGLSFPEVCAHTYSEVLYVDFKPKNEISARLEKRALLVENGIERVLTGDEVEKQRSVYAYKVEALDELSGMPACHGKVKGTVKVVVAMKEMSKVKKGDILVASETTPEYVPAMKLAGAIVADKGGVTSHAAIVSRELNVPCVIGTKFATRVFKDGDLVEVDAFKGLVKKLK